MMKNIILCLRSLILFILLIITTSIGAQVIRVIGSVTDENNSPIPGVNITDESTKHLIAVTDNSGKYAANVLTTSTLQFSFMGYKTRTVKVKGQSNIDVVMSSSSIALNEVQVVAKRIVKKVVAEPTTIEVVGQYFHVRTRIKVPNDLFDSNCRLVVQPVLHDLTSKKDVNMKPIVYDGTEYNMTQKRMYDFDITHDSLNAFVKVKDNSIRRMKEGKSVKFDLLAYHDSVYVRNRTHSFSCDVFMAIEDYRKIFYGDTTTIANGTVNPLRFLDFKFGPSLITDSAYFPKGEMQLLDGKGNINLVFPIGSSSLDMGNKTNQNEINKLNAQLKEIENGNGTQLRNFHIQGLASPDGNYLYNVKLAKERMNGSLKIIVSQLNPETRRSLKVSADAKVASWDDLSQLLRKDSLKKEATAVDNNIALFRKNNNGLYSAMRHLPFYNNLLEKTYLPKLRKSEYSFMYTLYRHLTIDEISALYAKNPKQLSTYEFWRLYNSKKNATEKERLCREALNIYPSFMMAANDLSVCLINRSEYNDSILEPFANEKAPKELNMNQVVNLLEVGRIDKADTLSNYIPENEHTKLMKAVVGVMNGKYEDNYTTIAETGLHNQALMLLAMKKNEDALKIVEQLPTSEAMTYYLKATCLNRLDKAVEAYDALKKAMDMDPQLKKMAKIDGDVNQLLPKDDE
jgi:hypothetical protein